MAELSNTTVIIPAHNRPDHLRRLLRYYSATNLRIIVADSSHNRCSFIDEYPAVTYRHFPGYEFLLKTYEVLPLLTTPYVFFCADDDFMTPTGIAQITQFLETHPDYSSAQGHYLTFEQRRRGIEFSPRYIRNFNKRMDAETGAERLLQYKDLYASLLYGVTRSELFKEMYTACVSDNKELRFSNLYLAETYFNLYTLLHGKHATIPVFYCSRERIAGSAASTTVPLETVMTAPEYRAEYTHFIRILAEKLARQDQLSLESSQEIIRRTLRAPQTSTSLHLKRKLLEWSEKHLLTQWINRLMLQRYKQKGVKAVRGLDSYPLSVATPEKQAIVESIEYYNQLKR